MDLKHHDQMSNVLYFSDDPFEAAKSHVDFHVGRQLRCVCRILSSVWLMSPHATLDWGKHDEPAPFGEPQWLVADLFGNRILRPLPDQPSVQWASLYGGNYEWLWKHGMALSDEFAFRFDRHHCMVPIIRSLEAVPDTLLGSVNTWCDAPAVLPADFLGEDSPSRYREYYRKEKPGSLIYTRRAPPNWIHDISIFKE